MEHVKLSFGRISVPLEDYAIQGNSVLGIKESGKSYSATYAAERLMDAGIPITGIDPIGIWHNLRIPGKGKSYPVVVVGGKHGDLPLTPASAEATMRAAMAAGVSIVFDLYDVRLSKKDWRDIVVAVVKVLLFENGAHGLRHVFIEEAPEFVPQKIAPEQGMVYSFVERLVRMGGNAHLGVTLIGQRAEEMNKAVLELCDLLVLHRQKGRRSLENLAKWIEVAAPGIENDVAATVPTLKNGEAYVWPRGEPTPVRTSIPEKNTFHPDRRQRHKADVAETKRMDAGEFVSKMKAELAKITPAPLPTGRIVNMNEVKAHAAAEYERGKAEGELIGQDRARREAQRIFTERLEGALNELVKGPSFGVGVAAHPEVKAAQRAANNVLRKHVDAVGVPAGEFAVLRCVAMYAAGVARSVVTVMTGYKRSTRDRYIAQLVDKGQLAQDGGRIKLTAAGQKALGANYEPLPTGRALREYWIARLPEGERRIFERVVAAYPNDVDRGEISAHSGYKRSTRDRYLAQLQARQLVDCMGDGVVKASEALFQ